MTDHYYSRSPQASHARQTFEVTVRNVTLTFVTDAGVFSKHRLDYGSELLIKHLSIPMHARFLDVGCGYGAIGLFAAALNESAEVTMLDVNERAVALAQENARRNQLDRVHIIQSDVFEQLQADDKFTMIVTNPPIRAGKQIVHRMYEEAYERLDDGGELWVVIQKKQGAESTQQKLRSLYTEVEEITKAKGYRVYKAIK